MEPLLRVEHVRKVYRSGREDLTVFENVSFALERNCFATLAGESGSGKSTLLNIIGGLDAPSGGSVLAGTLDITAMSERELTVYRNRFIGFVFQFHYLLKEFTALENVMLPSYMAGTPRKKAAEKAAKLISLVGLSGRTDHYPSQLSGGEQQRVAIARALINDPELVLADEPTGNLDEKNSAMIIELLRSIVEERGTSLLLVTHNPAIASLGEPRLYLKGGGLSKDGGVL